MLSGRALAGHLLWRICLRLTILQVMLALRRTGCNPVPYGGIFWKLASHRIVQSGAQSYQLWELMLDVVIIQSELCTRIILLCKIIADSRL